MEWKSALAKGRKTLKRIPEEGICEAESMLDNFFWCSLLEDGHRQYALMELGANRPMNGRLWFMPAQFSQKWLEGRGFICYNKSEYALTLFRTGLNPSPCGGNGESRYLRRCWIDETGYRGWFTWFYISILLHKYRYFLISTCFPHKQPLYNFMQFHTTPRRNGVKMVYGKSDCGRENDTLLLPQEIEQKFLTKHTAIGMTAQRICRWLFHFLLDLLHSKFPVIAWYCD